MKKILLVALLIISACNDKPENPCTPVPTQEPTPSPTPAPEVGRKVLVLDSFDKPNQAKDADWKDTVYRTVFNGAKTGFIIKGDLCLFIGEADMIMPIDIKHPSAKEYPAGVYYDALVPLTSNNCTDAKFAWLDVGDSYSKNGININIKKLEQKVLPVPSITLFMQLEPYAFVKGINKGKYFEDEAKSLQALTLLKEHRVQPIKSWVSESAEYNSGNWSFKQYAHDFAYGPVNVPMNKIVNTYSDKLKSPWFYVMDEPGLGAKATLQNRINELKTNSPKVLRMVTTTYDYPATGIDIYCPVFQHIKDRSKYGPRMWGYISCMSNGCGENRDWLADVNAYTHQDYNRSGEPDMVIDAPSEDLFAFYLLAITTKLESILYFDTISQWMLANRGVDVFKDMYNFGGNGDGTLLYPDYDNKRAYPSLRLKLLREASYLADAVILSNSSSELVDFKSTTDWKIPSNFRNKVYTKLK